MVRIPDEDPACFAHAPEAQRAFLSLVVSQVCVFVCVCVRVCVREREKQTDSVCDIPFVDPA